MPSDETIAAAPDVTKAIAPAEPSPLNRYIPLLVWAGVILTLLLVPAKIIGYGFLPGDDALRHAAKAVSGKPWSEILVIRPGFEMDIHPGWHAILGGVHQWLNCNTETLVVISMFGLMLLVNLSILPWLRRPEAWLASLLVTSIFAPAFFKRLMIGRPYSVTIAVFVTLLLMWSRLGKRRPAALHIGVTVGLVALAAWIHSAWYLLLFPAFALVLCGRWRPAVWFAGCWAAGAFLGACFTGHPFQFLSQSYRLLTGVFGEFVLTRSLVTELLPSDGEFLLVLAVVAMLLWRSRAPGWNARELLEPIFLMAIIGWILGLKVYRFWWDWGMPAILLWLTLGFQQQLLNWVPADSLKRLLISGALAVAVFFSTTSDRGSRWTANLTKEYLNYQDPALQGWWAEKDGIFYSADMSFFYDTFYRNPKAPGRYTLGFEPSLMPPEDLGVVRKVQWNFGDVRAYEPWIQKLRPQDRLVLRASWLRAAGQPKIPELEWHYASDFWIGRLKPRAQ